MRERHEIEITGRRIKLFPTFFEKYAQCELFLTLADKMDDH